ncbi:MAG TPA: cation diffusion facilitator family transporter [Pyrinomonadaceae bacterium]|nr:cation diffusion facilitator family transporter [Pyrinomonadaceae bacterium]
MTESATTATSRAARPAEARVKQRAALLSVVTAASLIALKTTTGFLTGSISVWASLLDSAMDVFASIVNYFAVRAATRPPDAEHPYGRGKAESLAGLLQAAVISVSGLFLISEAVGRLLRPRPTSHEWLGVATMFVAAAASVLLVARLRRTADETESPALAADAAHYASDVYTNGAALLALFVTALTRWPLADPLISIAISLYILWTAVGVGRESVGDLMDRRLPKWVDRKIARVVGRYRKQGVLGFHDLRTRRSGSQKFIDLHLEVERHKTLEEAHELTVRVLRDIEREVPRSRVQIHTDPAGD